MGLTYSLLIVFNTLGPFLIQNKFHYSPIFFGHLALVLGLFFLVATFVSRYFLKYFSAEQLLPIAIYSFFVLVSLILLISYFFAQSIHIVSISSALMFFAAGIIFPLSMGKGLSLFRHIAGTASATMYLINVLITSCTAFLVSYINIQSAVPLIGVYFLLMLICMIIYWGLFRDKFHHEA
jgi:MFS transporter, DHA1 family, multidrug resistance protein